jgi:hypothetical protein
MRRGSSKRGSSNRQDHPCVPCSRCLHRLTQLLRTANPQPAVRLVDPNQLQGPSSSSKFMSSSISSKCALACNSNNRQGPSCAASATATTGRALHAQHSAAACTA